MLLTYLRKKGLAKASKKSSREANEGAIGFYENNSVCILIKINSETDFAAKSDTFLNFVDYIGNTILDLNKTELSSVEKEEIISFLGTLDDDDDVQNVYTNAKL